MFTPALNAAELSTALSGKFSAFHFVANGGQGAVYRALPASANGPRPIALKVYYPGSLQERTVREVDALRKIRCPHIVKLCDAGHVMLRGKKCIYVATDFINGQVLSDVLTKGPLDVQTTAAIGRGMAAAIDALWRERIVHRDIKPANIMVDSSGQSILIDLGVARHLSLTPLTTIGKTWGTEGYMSPEHARAARQLSCKSDVFALGVVLQESLLGQHPTGHDQLALARGGPPLATLNVSVPTGLGSLIDAMVSPDPTRRPLPKELVQNLAPYCAP